jgi:hypothetical protein
LSRIVFIISVLALELLGCATTDQTSPQPTVTRLNGEQAKVYISDRTINWVGGGVYYDPNGKVEVELTMRVISSGDWKVFDDGRVCYQIANWEEYCHIYISENGTITRHYIKNAR